MRDEQYLHDEKGKKTAVVIPIEKYEEMLADIHDLALIAERKDEPIVSFDEVKKRLKADGLIKKQLNKKHARQIFY